MDERNMFNHKNHTPICYPTLANQLGNFPNRIAGLITPKTEKIDIGGKLMKLTAVITIFEKEKNHGYESRQLYVWHKGRTARLYCWLCGYD